MYVRVCTNIHVRMYSIMYVRVCSIMYVRMYSTRFVRLREREVALVSEH